jgi:hypothetical protein
MYMLLVVVLIIAIAAGIYKCSPEEESSLARRLETPERLEQDIQRHIEEGMKRNQRALEELEKNE